MDSLAPDDLNKHFKFSLSSTGIYDSNVNHYLSSASSSSDCSATINNLSFSLHQRLHPPFSSSSFSGKRISDILRHFMLTLFRIGFYVFVILSLSDCWFQVGSTAAAAVLVIGEDKPTQDYDALNSSSLPVVQLPIPQALILDANSEKLRLRSNDTSVNDGNSGPLTATSYSHSGISSNNSNNNNSINTMFTTATTATKSTAAATLSALHSNGIINTITSTLSSLPSNGTEWSTLGGGTSSPTLSLSPSSSTSSPLGEFTMPAVHTVVVCIVLLFVILGTIVGNVLVCIAVCMVRKLRRPCNYLLVSLALSDLCVAVLVMPMALLYEVLEKWNFGTLLCDVWVSFDVLCCTASILNLCAISVDRYLAITKPLEYGVKRTPRRMMLCVALVWLAAACISLPPLLILGNEHVDETGKPMCSVCQNFAYQIYATLGSFYIPLAVMLFVYYQIFRAARRIVLEEKRAQTHLQHALNGTGSPPGHTELDGNGQPHRHSSYGNTSLNYSTCGGLSTSHNSGGGHGGGSGSSGLLGSPHQKKLRFQLAKEKKASTTLGIIMSAFTICWLPFFILALIRPFVESETTHVPQSLSSLFLWLGYANSLLNPIIYATLNRDFRKPFQEILYFRCSSLNTMMRENYYQDQYGEPPSQRVMLGDERHGARESFL